jgi:outer membrane usher protein
MAMWAACATMFVAAPVFAQSASETSAHDASAPIAPAPAAANPSAETKDQRALLSLSVNNALHGETSVVLRGKDVMVRVDDLKNAGLRGFVGTRMTIKGQGMVSLASLAPAITFEFDDRELTLKLVATTALLAPSELSFGTGRPADLEFRRDTSGFVNYSMTLSNFTTWGGFFEGGFSYKGGLLYSGLSATATSVTRGLSNYTYDDRTDLRRYVVGDTFVSTGILGGTALLGGLSIAKNFSIDPYFIRFPTQDVAGVLTTPSTVGVYRNGLLIKQEELPPGSFNLNNIPSIIGQGNTQVVIRDALGNVREINTPYYVGAQLLQKGLSEYDYGIGFQRNDLTTSFEYGAPSASASHRYGLTDWLTIGGRLEATRDLFSAGPSLSLGTLAGQFDCALALSRDGSADGAAASVGYQYLSQKFGGSASMQWMSPQYANLGLKSSLDRAIVQGQASLTKYLGYSITVGVQYSYQRYEIRPTQHAISFTETSRLSRRLNLMVTVTRALPENMTPATNDVFVGLTYFFGHDTVGSISGDDSTGKSGTVALQKSLPLGNGYGFLLQAREGYQEQENAFFQYQNDYGRYEADYTHTPGQNATQLSIAGGLVAIGDRVIPTRPVQDGYALVRVPGLENIPAEWSNQLVGFTNKNGDVLIPNLLPYYGNQVSIADTSVPIDYALDTDRRVIAVPYRGGALVTFPVHRIQQITGTLRIQMAGQTIIPGLGEITVDSDGHAFSSPIGEKGEFYFDSLPAGKYPASVDFSSGTCRFEIEIPKSDKSIVKLGQQTCVYAETSSAK